MCHEHSDINIYCLQILFTTLVCVSTSFHTIKSDSMPKGVLFSSSGFCNSHIHIHPCSRGWGGGRLHIIAELKAIILSS